MRLLGQSFFLQKDFVRTKSIKSNKCTKNQPSKSTKSTKTPRQKHKDANKRISDFFLKKKNLFIKKRLGIALFIFFAYEKILHAPKAPKAQRRNQAKAQNDTSEQQGYGSPTTPIIVLLYMQTKTSFLGPFKKLFFE